jgi:hypothetical protein
MISSLAANTDAGETRSGGAMSGEAARALPQQPHAAAAIHAALTHPSLA